MSIYLKAKLPVGFKANGVAAGIKKRSKLDLGIFYSSIPAKASCLFTANKIQAAPILVCKDHLRSNNKFQAIIVNSGNANCFNGQSGMRHAKLTAQYAAGVLGIASNRVLVASTGIIARPMPIEKIKKAMPALVLGLSKVGINKANKSIMTTDTFSKAVTSSFKVGNKAVTICGIAKGAGMIAPNMATMLCFIFTDANIAQSALNKALRMSANQSFNCITIDGCMSTNDSIMLLANGQAGNTEISSGRSLKLFSQGLDAVCLGLAKMLIQDAEGATKFIKIKVNQAKSYKDAKSVALSIANSNLFKTAMFASSTNCLGRIVASAGASGVEIKEKNLKVKYSDLKKKEVEITVSLGQGKENATVFTSDLSYEYVKINAEYN